MNTIYQVIDSGVLDALDLNCAEKIVYAADRAYGLNLPKEALKLSAGFGGGMGIMSVCGALTGAVMVLSHLFVEDHAHESDRIKKLTKELFTRYNHGMGAINCGTLKTRYRRADIGCKNVILAAAEILDDIIARERG